MSITLSRASSQAFARFAVPELTSDGWQGDAWEHHIRDSPSLLGGLFLVELLIRLLHFAARLHHMESNGWRPNDLLRNFSK